MDVSLLCGAMVCATLVSIGAPIWLHVGPSMLVMHVEDAYEPMATDSKLLLSCPIDACIPLRGPDTSGELPYVCMVLIGLPAPSSGACTLACLQWLEVLSRYCDCNAAIVRPGVAIGTGTLVATAPCCMSMHSDDDGSAPDTGVGGVGGLRGASTV